MKPIKQFILESTRSFNEINIFKGVNGAIVSDEIINLLRNSSKKINLSDRKSVRNFWERLLGVTRFGNEALRSIGLRTADNLRDALLLNADKIIEMWPEAASSKIKDFNLSEHERKYRTWKKSADYVKGENFAGKDSFADASEDELERIMVVYDANDPGNPDTVKQFKLTGPINKDNQDLINMFKTEWKYETGLKYFDARPCRLSYYLSKSDAELQKTYDSDIIGLDD